MEFNNNDNDQFFNVFTALEPLRGYREESQSKKSNSDELDYLENLDFLNSFQDFSFEFPGLESPSFNIDISEIFNNFLNQNQDYSEQTQSYNDHPDTIFTDKSQFVKTLNNVYRKVLQQRGIDPNFAPMLVAQDVLESGWGKKPKGKYNYGNISAGDKGHGYVAVGTHKFTNYASLTDYANAKIDLLSRDRYKFFSTFKASSNVATSMQVLADKGYCPRSPQYGQKVAQVYDSVIKQLNSPSKSESKESSIYASTAPKYTGPIDRGLISIDIEDLLKQEGITHINGKKIKFGNKQLRAKNASFGVKNSHHKERDPYTGNANARDISIPGGSMADYAEFRRQLLANPRVREWFKQKGWGIINEVTKAALSKTNGTGPHFHFGPDQWARRTWNYWLSNPSVDVTRIISKK